MIYTFDNPSVGKAMILVSQHVEWTNILLHCRIQKVSEQFLFLISKYDNIKETVSGNRGYSALLTNQNRFIKLSNTLKLEFNNKVYYNKEKYSAE